MNFIWNGCKNSLEQKFSLQPSFYEEQKASHNMDHLLKQSIKICLICIIFLPFKILSTFWFEWESRMEKAQHGLRLLWDKHRMSKLKLYGQKETKNKGELQLKWMKWLKYDKESKFAGSARQYVITCGQWINCNLISSPTFSLYFKDKYNRSLAW